MSAAAVQSAARTLGEAIREGAARLRDAGIPSAMLDARVLFLDAAKVSLEAYLANPALTLEARAQAKGEAFLARRIRREPVAHILGYREFYGRPFATGPEALVPRPESEEVIDAVLTETAAGAPLRVLDLGTGTGCLLLTILAERPYAEGIGIDRSEAAVRLAARNASQLDLAARASFVAGDWALAVDGRFDVVLANPPYIPSDLLTGLEPDVRDYDPELALDGGPDGLDAYRAIASQLDGLLAPRGMAVFELGVETAHGAAEIMAQSGFAVGPIRPDLAGLPRVLCTQMRTADRQKKGWKGPNEGLS